MDVTDLTTTSTKVQALSSPRSAMPIVDWPRRIRKHRSDERPGWWIGGWVLGMTQKKLR